MTTPFFYRVKVLQTGELSIEQFEVISGNAIGVIILTHGRKKFVKHYKNDCKRRFAYQSPEDAIKQFINAKQAVLLNINASMKKTESIIAQAESLLKQRKIL